MSKTLNAAKTNTGAALSAAVATALAKVNAGIAAANRAANEATDETRESYIYTPTTTTAPTAGGVSRIPVVTPAITEEMFFDGVLFKRKEKESEEDDSDEVRESRPVMTGSVEIKGVKVQLAAFMKRAETSGDNYLQLTVGEKDQAHYYGVLFRNVGRDNKTVSYSGNLQIVRCDKRQKFEREVWDNAPTLRVTGNRVRSADGGARIVLRFMPAKVGDHELPM